MVDSTAKPHADSGERIDVKYQYGLCTWARHFNVSEQTVKAAVAAVGDRVDHVRAHLRSHSALRPGHQERPLAN